MTLGRRIPRNLWLWLVTVYPVVLVAFATIHLVLLPRSGLLGIAAVLETHLFLAAILLVPIAIGRPFWPLRLALLVAVAFGVLRFGHEWFSMPSQGDGRDLRVISWNLEFGARPAADSALELGRSDAALVALQELTTADAAAIEADATLRARYPYRALFPDPTYWGIGLLSAYPLSDVVAFMDPVGLEAVVATAEGSVRVINAHPAPATLPRLGPLVDPFGFNPTMRDAAIDRIRARIDAALARHERLIVVGDFNTVPTEPAYRDLSSGLRDVHVDAGRGPGWTWRPSSLERLGIGLLRIDLALVGPGLVPLGSSTRCRQPGDHCLLISEIAVR